MSGWKKPLLVVLATAPIAILLLSFALMARSEMAFDEARCPYEERERREVAPGVAVREDARACTDDAEEHRWVILRDGAEPFELGRRRLEADLYERYSWTAAEEEGRVRIEIRNPGQDPRVFREPAQSEATPPR